MNTKMAVDEILIAEFFGEGSVWRAEGKCEECNHVVTETGVEESVSLFLVCPSCGKTCSGYNKIKLT